MSTNLTCRICKTLGRMRDTGLRTCEDQRHLGEYAVYFCEACWNGFTTPDIADETGELLPDTPAEDLSNSARLLLRWFVDRRVKKLESVLPVHEARILDIGGGACAFANALALRGHRVTAIEPNTRNRKFADTASNVSFLAERFSPELVRRNLLERHSFDAVTLWHSLEHLANPAEVLRTIHEILKPRGVMLVSVPSFDSLLANIGGRYWTYLDVPHHVSYFTQQGLQRLVRDAGFSVVCRFRFSVEYDSFGWYQTLLNLMTRSHNYLYNRKKKGRRDESYLRYPRWTKLMTMLSPFLLPIVGLLSVVSVILKRPACIEVAARRESS